MKLELLLPLVDSYVMTAILIYLILVISGSLYDKKMNFFFPLFLQAMLSMLVVFPPILHMIPCGFIICVQKKNEIVVSNICLLSHLLCWCLMPSQIST
jgi:hypothetical protein